MEIKKLFYSMGEVSEMFDVNPSLIRYWESQFDVLRPKKNKKGNRMFSPQDVEQIKLIYHLVKEKGMTLEGAKKSLRSNRDALARDAELLERLQRVKSLLAEVREELKAADGELIVGAEPAPETSAEAAASTEAAAEPNPGNPARKGRKPRAKKEDEGSKELFAFYEQSLF